MKTVLLVGGTAETPALAESLADAGFSVLVCTATELPIRIAERDSIRRHCGRMTADEFAQLLQDERIDLVLNAAHPYATGVRDASRIAAARVGVPHVDYVRPESELSTVGVDVRLADSHVQAAQLAVSLATRILLTIGVNHLTPYVEAARGANCELVVRVLPREESVAACRAAGLRDDQILLTRGASTVAENVAIIREHGVTVLVTKESGALGGVLEKLEAARQSGCVVVVVRRPVQVVDSGIKTVADAVSRVRALLDCSICEGDAVAVKE